ncbi:ribonuclease Oy-like [Fopius arisanus]|uniref:Ribonuclease Oy-like n=1 Tax=Fopius arisanus TaxID=64838 RepID=A0A9R1TTJ8_9HYME|nr:PREDICTED: ribonuclease Oy-like [Fopius arisanus]
MRTWGKWFVVLLVMLIGSAQTNARRRKNPRNRRVNATKNSTAFDVLIFTQHWPQTVCYTWKQESPDHSCDLPHDDEWTIHGLWPTKFHKLGPQFCNPSLHFNVAALSPIQKEMEVKWIDVENGTKPFSFWKHEWQKHGTCSAVLEPLNTELKYFEMGLKLLDVYDMKHVLEKADIHPGLSYPVQAFLDGVYKVLGKKCQVECVSNKKEKKSYLFEIRICFDKSLNLIDCDGVAGFPTNCSPKRQILYPGTVPIEYHVLQI